MNNKLVIGKYLLAMGENDQTQIHLSRLFPGLGTKINPYHRYKALRRKEFVNVNAGKPAVICFLLRQIKVVDLIFEGFAAAGLLFYCRENGTG
jgi:hypothetical protein